MKWYLWVCNSCGAEMRINYFAEEKDYDRFKQCGCKANGTLEYNTEYEEGEKS